jgi:hypothetical protein
LGEGKRLNTESADELPMTAPVFVGLYVTLIPSEGI